MPAFALTLLLAVAPSPFVVGESAPVLTLPSSEDGAPRSLRDFRGEKLMLHVWASW